MESETQVNSDDMPQTVPHDVLGAEKELCCILCIRKEENSSLRRKLFKNATKTDICRTLENTLQITVDTCMEKRFFFINQKLFFSLHMSFQVNLLQANVS